MTNNSHCYYRIHACRWLAHGYNYISFHKTLCYTVSFCVEVSRMFIQWHFKCTFFLFFFIIGRVGVCDLLRQMPDRIKGANFYRQSNLKHIMCYRWLAEAYSPFSPSLVQCTWVGALLLSMIVLPFRSRSKALTIFIRCLGNFEMLLVGFSINIFRFLSPEWVPSKVIKIKAMPQVYRRLSLQPYHWIRHSSTRKYLEYDPI